MALPLNSQYPLPPQRRGRPAKYPFAEMRPGQSFDVPVVGRTVQQVRNAIHQSLHGLRQRGHVKGYFVTKQVGNVVRCWRTA